MFSAPRLTHLAPALVAIWLTATVCRAEIIVNSPEELAAALETSGTIALAPGDYGAVTIRARESLTLTAADPTAPPTLRELKVVRSQGITVRGIRLTGANDETGYPTGTGITIRASRGVTIADCIVSTLDIGLYAEEVRDLTISGNTFSGIGLDGLELTEVQSVTITGNTFRDFTRDPDSTRHSDMIQFWTTGAATASRDILIADNLLDAGNGPWTQSIFMRNEQADSGAAGEEMWYRNVTIRDNEIRNAHRHGITVGETIGLVITGNQVLWQRGAIQPVGNRDLFLPAINVSSVAREVTITDNTFYQLSGFRRQAGWLVRNNRSARNLAP